MSGMDVALTVLATYSMIASSHPPVENRRDILQVEARHRPSIRRLCGLSPGRTCGSMRLTVCAGRDSGRDHTYLV